MSAGLEAYLHAHIPVSAAMGVTVLEAGPARVVLSAPLGPNVNHRSTMFGGSESALAILSAWSLAHLRVRDRGLEARVVIQRNAMEYLRPVRGEAVATCRAPDSWEAFDAALARRGKGRIRLEAEVTSAGETVGRFEGVYVALGLEGGR